MEDVESRRDRVQALGQDPTAQPVTMLALLRYRTLAQYPAGSGEAACTGREAFHRYALGFIPLVEQIGGRVLFMGQVAATVVGPESERWDDVIIVEYSSEADFLRLIQSDAHRAVAHHRAAALEDDRLIAMRPRVSP